MKKNEIYPSYFKRSDGVLIAIASKDKTFMVYPQGKNNNPGVTLDHYITRKMALRLYGTGERITGEEFKKAYEKIYSAYLTHILAQ